MNINETNYKKEIKMINEWQKYEEHTCVSEFRDNRQEVTLRCPKCRVVFISTSWEGCFHCDFKWGDKV